MSSATSTPSNEARRMAPERTREVDAQAAPVAVSLLTGGTDRHYAFGLAMALVAQGARLEVVGSDLVDSLEMHSTPGLTFFNLQGSMNAASLSKKLKRIARFYGRLIQYASDAQPRLFHILWNNKLQFVDRTLLMAYYKHLGKKVVFTAHNVNAGKRDRSNTLLNRLTLKAQYSLADHIFVHTEKMKTELVDEFRLPIAKVSVIPFGINNAVPDTGLSMMTARQRLGLRKEDRTILFFGAIKGYKGLEYLVEAFRQIGTQDGSCRLVIAGEPKKGHEQYFAEIQQALQQHPYRTSILQKLEFIPDDETEIYFKAADVVVLPYTSIFQSGVLFLAYSFGTPVIVSDVGSLKADVVEGQTGFVCRPCDSRDLAAVIERYFASDLFRNLAKRREDIRDYVRSRNSWDTVGAMTMKVYQELLTR